MVESVAATTAKPGIPAGEALLQVLRMQGVRAIFSSPGSEWPALWDALEAPPPPGAEPFKFFNTRHESLAVAMATGYQKATGELVAVALHSTVGPLQGAMAIQMARRDGVPMVVMSGDSNTWGLDPDFDPGPQWLRNLTETGGADRAVASISKWAEHVGNVRQLGEMVQQACRAASAPPQGPAFLYIPLEVTLQTVPAEAMPVAPAPRPRYAPDPEVLDRMAELLLSARNPVIVTEEAGRDPQNVGRLVQLAELLGAAVLESITPAYVNFPTSHPLHQGYQAAPVIADADVILLLGARGPWHPPHLPEHVQAKVLLADEEPAKLSYPLWPYRVDEHAIGSLSLTIQGLLDRVSAEPPAADAVRERSERWAARHRKLHDGWREEATSASSKTPIDPRWLCQELGDLMPEDAVVTEETTTTRQYILRHLPRVRPGGYVTRMTGGLGVGLSAALGLKVAQPERPVVCIIGDGAYNYNPVLAALGCMQEYDAPILTVVVNNRSYASMKSGHQALFPEGWAAKTGRWNGSSISPAPEYSMLATACGGYGERVEDPARIRGAFTAALEAVREGRVAVLDVIVDAADLRRR